MDIDPRESIPIPEDLDATIMRGIVQGRMLVEQRRRMYKRAARVMCCFVLVTGLFFGGICTSPAFAAAMEEVPFLGQLVRMFSKNQPLVEGGEQGGSECAAITMERYHDREQIRIDFGQADASSYSGAFAAYPKTVTLTLPDTHRVELLSEISRAKDTSQYIKSVYEMPAGTPDVSVIQLELDTDADVEIEEYRDPGGLVIRLLPCSPDPKTIYSVRTLSYSADDCEALFSEHTDQPARMLQDDQGLFFMELEQCESLSEAEALLGTLTGAYLIEARTANNVPLCYKTMEAYEKDQMLNEYHQILTNACTVEPILAFLEEHYDTADTGAREELLAGLEGFLEVPDGSENWSQVTEFYDRHGLTPPQERRPYIAGQ